MVLSPSRKKRKGALLFLNDNLCIKYGRQRHLPEASTLVFIARNTCIPVPKVYCAFSRNGRSYILMERVTGESLAQNWIARTPESKAKILHQLSTMINDLRRLPAARSAVANSNGGPLWDSRLPGKSPEFGPFESIDAFHRHLRGGIEKAEETDWPPEIKQLMALQDKDWGRPVFTHGDLSSLNILARGDTITAIVDWETAGWYPYYWEYTSACQVSIRNLFWREEVDKFLQACPNELKMEELRRTYFGDY
jgi:aminoglycoside phosphotransferase (APT) family kinase protein